jgi:hypothetical protein
LHPVHGPGTASLACAGRTRGSGASGFLEVCCTNNRGARFCRPTPASERSCANQNSSTTHT